MLLKRQSLSTVHENLDTELQTLRKELHAKAETMLGYPQRPLKQRSYELHNVLCELGIKPFTQESVDRYKAMLRVRPPLVCYLLALLTAALVYGTVCAFRWSSDPINEAHYHDAAFIIWLAGLAGIGVGLWVGINTVKRYFGTKRTWHSIRFDQLQYSEHRSKVNVPDFALETALRVKEAMPGPGVVFGIEYLSEKYQEIRLIDPDPFLVASLGSETYYLEVWDERDYKEEREQ